MKMIAMSAAAMLMSAVPAAAQEADHDALCFVTMTSFWGKAAEGKMDIPPEMLDQTKISVGFFAGRLNARLSGPALAQAIAPARTAVFAMSLDEQKKLTADCVRTFQTAIRAVGEASKE